MDRILRKLKRVAKRLLKREANVRVMRRSDGLLEELKFWQHWFQTKGDQWPDDYERRMDPQLPLQSELAKFAFGCPSETVEILDVGAGPLTRLGKSLPGKTIHLTPTDFLAPRYNELIDQLGVHPVVRTEFADAEHLVERFGAASFDIVHAQNCVDHMEHPARAIEQMIAVLRPGGTLYLRHEENEGRHNNYFSIHHWDFWLDDASGHFMIKHVHAPRPTDVTILTAAQGTSRTYREGKRVVFELTKSGERIARPTPPLPLGRAA